MRLLVAAHGTTLIQHGWHQSCKHDSLCALLAKVSDNAQEKIPPHTPPIAQSHGWHCKDKMSDVQHGLDEAADHPRSTPLGGFLAHCLRYGTGGFATADWLENKLEGYIQSSWQGGNAATLAITEAFLEASLVLPPPALSAAACKLTMALKSLADSLPAPQSAGITFAIMSGPH